jgi:putrescine transport system permease protein
VKAGGLLRFYCVLGFIFLYAPILSLIIFSFNENKLVTVWGGFSTKWYGELFRDPQILGSAWISFQVAFASATLAVILGLLAAYVLVRFGRFRGRALLTGMSTAPLVSRRGRCSSPGSAAGTRRPCRRPGSRAGG